MGGTKRKRGAGYYLKSAKQQRMGKRCLEKGMKGFFITCNFREREAKQEAYALLNEYANVLYGEEFEKVCRSSSVCL